MSLLQPYDLAGIHLRTRTVRSATYEGLAAPDGSVTPALQTAYTELARSGLGLLLTSYALVVDPQAPGAQLGIFSDAHVPSHKALVEAVHATGGAIGIQIVHLGRFATTEAVKIGPSNNVIAGVPPCTEATLQDMDRLVDLFVSAAVRAKAAGYDLVQLHAAHGFLLSQFLSGIFNKRTDAYGGSLENRARLLLRIATAVRAALGPTFPLGIKLNVSDFAPEGAGGLTFAESAQVAAWLATQAGVAFFEASGGTSVTPISASRAGAQATEGYHEEGAAAWRAALAPLTVKTHLALVGGIRRAATAQAFIDKGVCDLVSLSRPLIREPDLVAKWRADPANAKAMCISCNACFKTLATGSGLFCPIQKK